jgi:hypothetical protein
VLSGEATHTNFIVIGLTQISEESVFKQVYSSTCSTRELSINMTTILNVVKEGILIAWRKTTITHFITYLPNLISCGF